MFFAGIDTALVNAGLVILDGAGVPVYSGKPYPKKKWEGDDDSLFLTHRRVRDAANWVMHKVQLHAPPPDVFLAVEDYLLTGYQRSYKTAELVSLLKNWCWDRKIPYCMVAPAKTKKYVIKKKEVSKTEIIAFAQQDCPKVFEGVDKADYSDIADAYAIAKIGQLVYEAAQHPDSVAYTQGSKWEQRWKEILVGQGEPTGILNKPGLLQWQYAI